MESKTQPDDPEALVITPVGGADTAPVVANRGESVTIGRGLECRIRVEHAQVSKEHARISWTDGAWSITDLGSRNGTTVNRWGLTPNEPLVLRDGDAVSCGPCRFEVRLRGAGRPARGGGSGTYATRASIFMRLREGSREAQEVGWEDFRARYAPVIVGFSRNAGLPTQDGEDILQDVMLGFFRLAPDFEYDPQKGRFRGYLKRATLNAIRKRHRKAGPPVAGGDEALEDEVAGAHDSHWEDAWDEQLTARALEEAQGRFDQRTFEAFDLYTRRGVPAEEVAARLGLSVNSVHQAKSRVLNLVRTILDRLRADEG